VHLCTEDKGLYVIGCGDGPLCFFSKYTYEHCCIFKNFIVGLVADSVMLRDTIYANIGETVELYKNQLSRQIGSRNLTGPKTAYLYEACDQISDFCHQ
jgi:hypothetical protein